MDLLKIMLKPFRREMSAATEIPTPPPPVGKSKQATTPSYLKTAKPNPKSRILLEDRRTANTDLTTLRVQANTRETIRQFIKASPDLSAAVTSYIRTAITSGYTAVAKNPDGTCNPEGTSATAQLITRMNILSDPTLGYDGAPSIRSVCETWAKELLTYGGMAGELVLDKTLIPDFIQPVSYSQITLYPSADGKRLIPHQEANGQNVVLDIPTFFMVTLDQDPLNAYGESPIESALQPVLFSLDFMNDIRRIVKRAIHPRVIATIDEEKFRKTIPQDIIHDSDKLAGYMNSVITDLSERLNGLEPEDALVLFDTIGIEVIDHGNTNLSNEYKVIQELADAKMTTGAKVLPTVLGQSGGTSNVASAEVLMFMKYVEGSVWSKLNEMLSKIFTLAVRLLGHDVYVEFQFNAIDLRPDNELETFKALKQSRVLELLSIGLITDEEAAIQLTGHLPPPGYKPMMGTQFRPNTGQQPAGDGYNGASNSGSTMNQNLKSDAPSGGARGQNKKAEADVIHLGAAR
jgi:hypothetical protein